MGYPMANLSPYGKVWISSTQYVYGYQMKFLANIAKKEVLSKDEFKANLREYSMYNFIQDHLEDDPNAGYFYWDKTLKEISFAPTDDAKLSAALEDAGYIYMWEDDEEDDEA